MEERTTENEEEKGRDHFEQEQQQQQPYPPHVGEQGEHYTHSYVQMGYYAFPVGEYPSHMDHYG